MAFNEKTAQRIREILLNKGADFKEKTMFSGICFMVDNKMCCGTHIDKKTNEEYLLCRIGEKAQEKAMEKDNVIPMNFTGKSMKGYIFVVEEGFKSKKDLSYWLQLCLDFNPVAKASKKK
ncbi:MAG: TfoX/Sxy family protein [Bacteroidota bacterium]